MRMIRNISFMKWIIWLTMFLSHGYFLSTYNAHIQFKVHTYKIPAADSCIFPASNISFWVDKTKIEESFKTQQVFGLFNQCFQVYSSKPAPSFKTYSKVFANIVRFFRYSPTYIINRSLLI